MTASTRQRTAAGLSWLIEKFDLRGLYDKKEAELPEGEGEPPTMEKIRAAVLVHKLGRELTDGNWEAGFANKSASEAFHVFAHIVLEAANNHGDAAVEFLLHHTAWGKGEIDNSRDPGKYMNEDWVERDVARAASKNDAAKEKIVAELPVLPMPEPTQPTPERAATQPTNPAVDALVDLAARSAALSAQEDDGVLVPNLIGRARITNFAGGPKTGKSTLLLAALAGYAAPVPREFPGFGKPAKQLRVLYLSENHPDDDAVLLDAFGGAASMLQGVDRRAIPPEAMKSWSHFVRWVAQLVQHGNYDVVVLDSFEAWVPDLEDGNSSAQIAQRYGELSRVVAQARNVAIVCVLHTRKDAGPTLSFDDMLGSTKFRASSDYNIMLARVAPDDPKDTRIVMRREGRDPYALIRRVCGRLPDSVPAAIRNRDRVGPARLCYKIVGEIERDAEGREVARLRYELVDVPPEWASTKAPPTKLTKQDQQRLDDEVLVAACELFAAECGSKPVSVRRLVTDGYVARAAARMPLPSGYDPPGDRRVRQPEARLIAAGRLQRHDGGGVTVVSAVALLPLGEVQS